jgi:hypothetical protein
MLWMLRVFSLHLLHVLLLLLLLLLLHTPIVSTAGGVVLQVCW